MPSDSLFLGATGPIGWTAFLATYLIHSTVWILLTWQLTRPFLRIPTRLANWLWKLALVGGIITSILQVTVGVPRLWEPLRLAPAAPTGIIEPAGALLTQASIAEPFVQLPANHNPAPLSWPELLVGLWLGGAALSSAGLAAGWLVFLRRLSARRPLIGVQLEQWRDQVCEASGIRHPIRLTCSAVIASPMVLSGAEICLPARALTELSFEQQRSMLAHELAHIARHDPAWLFAAGAIQCLFFFQPLNRLAAGRVGETGEYLCDDWALAHTGDGLALARTLSRVATWASGASTPGIVAGMARTGSPWVRRVERALAWRPHASLESPRVWWGVLLAGLVAIMSCTVPGVVLQVNPPAVQSPSALVAVASIDPTPWPTGTAEASSVPAPGAGIGVTPPWTMASPAATQPIATTSPVSLVWPVAEPIRINQRYWSRHPGLDLNGKLGVPVRAAASGRVVVARADSSDTGYGNMVVLDHGSDLKTVYSHLQSYEVKAGDWVEQGQRIAAVGSTGLSTGPHLHFAIMFAGVWQDPTRFLPAH